jgi:hypothetical protein
MPSEMRLRGSRSRGRLKGARGQAVAGMEIGRLPLGRDGTASWHHHLPPAAARGNMPPAGTLDIIPCQSNGLRVMLRSVILP